MDEDDNDSMEVTKDEFDWILKKFESKKKQTYNFLMKAGDGFRNKIFKLSGRMIKKEAFPDKFYETVLERLWKRKLPREDLSNHRFGSYQI